MWQQTYTPIGDSLPLSALFAAVPIFTLLVLLGVLRKPAWMASLAGLAAAAVVAAGVYGMPPALLAGSVAYCAAFGLFPIGWVVFSAILLYRITLESGKFEVLKDSIGHLTNDRRLQALLIAFAFGAFIEGAAGFGTPVAVAAAMLTGLGFEPFYAAAACAGTQFLVSNFMGPQLTDILASLAAMLALLLVIRRRGGPPSKHSGREIALAWAPYLLLVTFVLLWGYKPLQAELNRFNILVNWPGLHNA